MPPIRITATTALAAARQLHADLRKATREASPLPGLEAVATGLGALEGPLVGRNLELDLALAAPLQPGQAEALARFIGPGFPAERLTALGTPCDVELPGARSLTVHLRPLGAAVPQRAGAPRPPLLLIAAPDTGSFTADARAAALRLAEERPVVMLAAPPDAALKEIGRPLKDVSWHSEFVNLLAPPEPGLVARFGTAPWDAAAEPLKAYGALAGLETLAQLFAVVVRQQSDDTRVKKAVTQQRLAKFQTRSPLAAGIGGGGADLLADVKARLARQAAEFERGVGERLQDLLGHPSGSLTREIEARLAGLSELAQELKSTAVATRVPQEFEDELNALMRERVAHHCAADLGALNDLFRLIAQDVERQLAHGGGPPVVLQFRYLTEERVRRLLDLYAVLQCTYKGELPKPGFAEYFGAVRKYAMVLIMSASMFGAARYLRQAQEIFIPITLILVAFGTYSVYTTAQHERAENMEKELEAARQSMRPELRRILAEIQKQWASTLSQHLSDELAQALSVVEAALKEAQARRGQEAAPEKERLTRQAQMLDASEKKLAGLAKTVEALGAQVAQARNDLKPLVQAALAPRAEAVARPAPAAARAAVPPPPAAPSPAPAAAVPAVNPGLARLEALRAARAARKGGGGEPA
jgi:HAMP domain-containing protein